MSSFGDLLSWGEQRLGHAQRAGFLLEDAAGRSLVWLRAHAMDSAPADIDQRYRDWVERVASGEPEAYVSGVTHFWKLRLRVTPDVLIPRPDTETLVECALDRGGAHPQRVADLGTGSGAVALSLAMERPTWQIVGTDRSEAALTVARRNALDCAFSGVRWRQGNWYEAFAPDERFDGLVSNPPYVAADDPALAPAVKHYEPATAVIADDDGLSDLNILIGQAPDHLHPGGWLAVEHGYAQAEAVATLFAHAGFDDIQCRKDLAGHPRVTSGRLR
ncbi:MAG: peptide chain release factor N(5)-glutamine methyltransferase [Pseudomonadota bacterium]|nr:peptide chain release factor N(5)-glutamine methyltransferase [Pseudomonadota bacterium]